MLHNHKTGRIVVWIGFALGLQIAVCSFNTGVFGTGCCYAAPQREGVPGGKFGAFGPFNPDKFLEQFMGQETEAQRKKLAAIEISWDEEQRYGKQALQSFLNELRGRRIRVVSRGREVEYLRALVKEIQPLMQHARRYRKIRVLVAETAETDARSFPGGTLVVFRGMFQATRSEAAMVAVLGHELSHMDHGHQLRQLKSMKLAQQTFTAPQRTFDFEKMMGNTMFLARTFARPFHPEQESEADADGVAWAYRKGYDPLELAKLFLRWDRRAKGRGDNVPAFFRTHPYHRDRYEAVLAQLEQLKRTEPRDDLYVGQKNLIQLVPRSKRRYDE